MPHFKFTHFLPATALLIAASLMPAVASATAISGNVSFQGNVVFDAPIVGIALEDLTVTSGPGIEETINNENCAILTPGSAPVGIGGAYPDTGTLTATIEISRGGNNDPTGNCRVQLRATGNDGGSVSASGTVSVLVTLADIQGNATVIADDILVRQSKTIAGLDSDCLKWIKKEIKLKGKCNTLLWKLGGTEGSLKCKNAGIEPPDCDPADYVDEVLALSFGQMNQQTDAVNADLIDLDLLKYQARCQRYLGKAAANFIAKRNNYVQKTCIDDLVDTDACRGTASQDSRSRLDLIAKCNDDAGNIQGTDVMSGLVIPDVDEPCDTQCIVAGDLDQNCMRDCFFLELSTLSDGVIGDVPECGNGVVQGAEACDDGNVADGDCCSAVCGNEPAGAQVCGTGACQVSVDLCNEGEPVTCTPGTPGVEAGNCADTIDNDCDGDTDLDDLDCL